MAHQAGVSAPEESVEAEVIQPATGSEIEPDDLPELEDIDSDSDVDSDDDATKIPRGPVAVWVATMRAEGIALEKTRAIALDKNDTHAVQECDQKIAELAKKIASATAWTVRILDNGECSSLC